MKYCFLPCLSVAVLIGVLFSSLQAQEIQAVPANATGVYQINDTISWKVSAAGENAAALSQVHFVIKKFGKTVIKEGDLDLSAGPATLEVALAEPATVLVSLKGKAAEKEIQKAVGAVVAPEKITPAGPRPDDFDVFWDSKISDLQKIPINAVEEAVDSEKPGVEYFKVTLDNINGTKVYGQLAKPQKEGVFPAVLIVQYAGVYGLPKSNVTNRAALGYLAFNIMAHDLPLDKPKEFYDETGKTTLKDYMGFGKYDRDQSYFLRMYLGCYRAADYLTGRKDWDGRIFVVEGGSQGGQQALVTAGLHPRVTAVMACVPAGCDAMGPGEGRLMGFPYWAGWAPTPDSKSMEVGRYFDAVNFASKIKGPALIGLGLIDTTCPPGGILAAANQIPGEKEVIILVDAEHQNKANAHDPYYKRYGIWSSFISRGEKPPAP